MKVITTVILTIIALSTSGQIKRADFYDLPSKNFNAGKFYTHKSNAGVRTIAYGGVCIGVGAAIAPISSVIISNDLKRKSKEVPADKYNDYVKRANRQQKTCNIISGVSCLAGVIVIFAGLDTLRDFPLSLEGRPGGFAIAYAF
jgi:hypothetical protein